MALRTGSTAPYAPTAAVVEVLSRYRDRGLSSPVTAEVVERAGVSSTLSRRTVQALKLLDFIDADGMPTEQLEALGRAPETDHQRLLREHLAGVYAEVFAFADPATDPYDRVRDAFRGFDPKGQRERMVSLFLGLLDYAGGDTSAATASRRRTEGNGSTAKKTAGSSRQAKKDDVVQVTAEGLSHTSGSARASLRSDSQGLPPGLLGLLQQIPRSGDGWTRHRRDTFLQAFTAVLDFSVPITSDEAAGRTEANSRVQTAGPQTVGGGD